MLGFIKSSAIHMSVVLTLGLLLTGCATPGDQQQVGVTQDQCNGQPNWCVKAANESNDDVSLYVDGQRYTSLSGGQVIWIPFPANSQHVINGCSEITRGWLEIPVRKVCGAGETVLMTQNQVFIAYPTQ